MKGAYVIRMRCEELKKLIVEEMKKSSEKDTVVYIRKIEMIQKLRDENGVIIHFNSLSPRVANAIQMKVRENIAAKIKSIEQKLKELKQRYITDQDVDLAEIEVLNELLREYQRIAEDSDYYLLIV